MTQPAIFFDVVVIGGGPVGLSLAIALKQIAAGCLRVAVVDPLLGIRASRVERSSMTSAIAAGQRSMLENLGVWGPIAKNAQLVRGMEITDSRLGDSIRPVLLEFGKEGPPGEFLAHMVFHSDLESALEQRARELGVAVFQSAARCIERRPASVEIELGDGVNLRASLLAGSDGRNSFVKKFAKIKSFRRDYLRRAIVAMIGLERDHDEIAIQHFLPAGTLALLPLQQRRFSVVWVEDSVRAQQICSSSQEEFLQQLLLRVGHRWGEIKLLDQPVSFPLSLEIAREFRADRIVLLGDAAHAIHPLAGQGLNLGLQDVAYLVDGLSTGLKAGLDIGSDSLLRSYQRKRQFDTLAMAALTDGLFELFSLEFGLARILRGAGMDLINTSGLFKSRLLTQAAGNPAAGPALFLQAQESPILPL